MQTALLQIYDFLLVYFDSVDWRLMILMLKIISSIISILLLLAVVFLIIQLRKNIKKSLEMAAASVLAPELPKKTMAKNWQSVLEKLESKDESNYKMAVIEADKIFDDILKRIGYQGEDMAERLKQITSAQLANIDEIWQVHKLRNRLVHELGFRIKHSQAKQAVEIYQRALEDLEAVWAYNLRSDIEIPRHSP